MTNAIKKATFLLLLVAIGLYSGGAISSEKELADAVSGEFQRHNYKKVIQLYRDYVEANADQSLPTAGARLAVVKVFYTQSLADTGEIDEAIKSLKEVLADLSPEVDTLKLQYDLANLLFLQRRYDEARGAFQKILLQSSQVNELLSKARERLALMKDKESKKKDFVSLQFLDIETNLDAGMVPDGAEAFLQQIAEQAAPGGPQSDQVQRLQERVKEVRAEKAKALLDEARRLYDKEKKYANVREILEQITQYYSDVSEMPSVEALFKQVNSRLGKGTGR